MLPSDALIVDRDAAEPGPGGERVGSGRRTPGVGTGNVSDQVAATVRIIQISILATATTVLARGCPVAPTPSMTA